MSGCISFLRTILGTFFLLLLFFVVLVGIPLAAISQIVTHRETVKSIILDDNVLSNLVDAGIQTLSTEMMSEEENTEAVTDAETEDAMESIREQFGNLISVGTIGEKIETVIDAYYDWFEGVTDYPTYSVKIADTPEQLADILQLGLVEKINSLPECDGTMSQPEEGTNPFELECRPADFETEEITNFMEENQDSNEFDDLFESATFDSESFEITPETTKSIQQTYGIIEILPVVLIAIYTALVLILIALIPRVSRSFTLVAIATLIPAGILLAISLSSGPVLNYIEEMAQQRLPYDALDFADAIFALIRSGAEPLFDKLLWFSIIAGGIGLFLLVLGIVFTIILRKKEAQRPPTIRRPGEEI